MAWITPTAVSTGDVLTASRYNADVKDNLTEIASFFSAWTAWSPTITQSGKTISTYSTRTGKYLKIGRLVIATGQVRLNSVSGTGSGNISCSIPFNAVQTSGFTDNSVFQYAVGSGQVIDAGGTFFNANCYLASQTTIIFSPQDITANNFNVAQNDSFYFHLIYEAAS